MKLDLLIENLKQVHEEFPDATAHLGWCSCCIYFKVPLGEKWKDFHNAIEGDEAEVVKLNIDKDEFEYFHNSWVSKERHADLHAE